MIKTLSNLLKQDKEKYKVPRKVQDVIPIRRMWSDGIFQVGSKFSKSYQFSDINYQVASLEDKKVMFLDYSELPLLPACAAPEYPSVPCGRKDAALRF